MVRKFENELRTRATLLNRLKDLGDGDSWEQFFNVYWRLIYGVARKAGLDNGEAMDVVQETMAAVARHMPGFKYDPAIGSFKGWLLNMARWRITDQLRKRGPLKRHRSRTHGDAISDTLGRIPDERLDLNAIWEADWQNNLFEAALENVKLRLEPEKFQIFDFYVNKEWSVKKVAETFKVSENVVYLVKSRVTGLLREEVRRLENEVT
jgi:RNA polymerase sigma-70 factor (ECF subfamily)